MTAKKMPITMTEVFTKGYTKYGKTHAGELLEGTTVEIFENEKITIMTLVEAGTRYVRAENVFDMQTGAAKMVPCEEHLVTRTFNVGDTAKVGSYNLIYTGEVTKITAKTVTVVEYAGTGCEKTHRFDIATFVQKNKHFDVAEAAEHNGRMYQTI